MTAHGTEPARHEDLTADRDRFRLLVENARDGIHQVDLASGRYVFMNPAQERLTGFSLQELDGMSLADAASRLHPDDRAAVERYLERVIAGEDPPAPIEYRWRVKDGEYRWFSDSRRLVRAADGSPEALIGISRDVTEHKRVAEELERNTAQFRALFTQLTEGLVLFDPDGNLLDMNPAALAIHGFDTLDGLRRHLESLVDTFELFDLAGRPLATHEWPIARVLRGETFASYVVRVRRPDTGREWYASYGGTPVRDADGRLLLAIVSLRDVTAQRRVEEELRSSKQTLEHLAHELDQRVQARTADLARSAEQLRQLHAELARAEQRERTHLANVLHDGLQQLLVAATMRLNAARRRTDAASAPVLEEVATLLDQSIEASRSLTVELSPPVLLDRGLVPALHWLADQMLARHGLRVQLTAAEDADPGAEELRLLLFQAVRELLFNVAKHARSTDAAVELRWQSGALVVEVSDDGRGFTPEPLAPPDSYGLFNVQQRVEWVGGSLAIASAPGQGTCVTLRVPTGPVRRAAPRPLHPTRQPGPRRSLAAAGAGARVRVLLADDHEMVRDGLVGLLEGYPDLDVVAVADDGDVAVELATAYRPHVVVMDVSMPRVDGIEATRQIAATLPEVRVVGLSMHESPEVAHEMRLAGAVAFVRKDGPIDDLVALIRSSAGLPSTNAEEHAAP